MDSNLLLLILLIILSGAFSGAEIALTSLSPARVRMLKYDKSFAGSAIYKLKKKPQSTLITILIGNNLVNILATVIATIWGIETFGDNTVGIITGALTFIILVFGEITPKTIAQKYAIGFSRLFAYPLLGLNFVLSPLTWIFNKFIHGLMWLFKAKSPIRTTSEEELLAMVDIGTKEGVIEEHEQEFIENVLEFTDTTVEEVMTIEKDIEAMDASMTINEAAQFFIEHSHSRMPVYENDLNSVIGISTVHDILSVLHGESKDKIKTLRDLHYNKVITVPKTKSINKLFKEFQKRRQHLAMVVDEHGETIGLVTLEDILEEIVGDITDEQDKEEKGIIMAGKNELEADGDTVIEDINEALKIKIAYPEHKTISLLILEQLQGFPHVGQKIHYGRITVQVKEMSEKKIEKVIITKNSEQNNK